MSKMLKLQYMDTMAHRKTQGIYSHDRARDTLLPMISQADAVQQAAALTPVPIGKYGSGHDERM